MKSNSPQTIEETEQAFLLIQSQAIKDFLDAMPEDERAFREWKNSSLASYIREVRNKERARIVGILEGMKRKRKPRHGTCCTCQECGFPNDADCECDRNEVLSDSITAINADDKRE